MDSANNKLIFFGGVCMWDLTLLLLMADTYLAKGKNTMANIKVSFMESASYIVFLQFFNTPKHIRADADKM